MEEFKMKSTCSKSSSTVDGKCTNTISKESVQVFCRLRPMVHPSDIPCMKVASDTTIFITPPETAVNYRNTSKVIQTSFSRVFTQNVSQSEVFHTVALPLINNLIKGKNGLLFAYGVTGSGKTYTMSGSLDNAGIMPRSLDVLFNSIQRYQTKRFFFKPNKLNGFDVQSDTSEFGNRQNGNSFINLKAPDNKHLKKEGDQQLNNNYIDLRDVQQSKETYTLPVDEDNAYAVFITYVEIYNNSVYDLLDEEEGKSKSLQSRIIREDRHKKMYVYGANEIEVKNSDEAIEVFHRGQCKRRIAHTALNSESSRSHNIFTIKLVQGPLDMHGEQIVQDKRVLSISQLSLVDLAGSERTNRSKNTGQRLREAGNINNSLMTLRSCLEILRENQVQGTNKIVPYRDSKLTHLFKHYFDGEGQIRMIICVNPRADDYDETIQVMKFAEISQEVQIARPIISKLDLGYMPGRRQANKIFKEAQHRLEQTGNAEVSHLEVDVGLVYSLGGPFPETEVTNPHNEEVITTLMRFLEVRLRKRNLLQANLHQKQNNLRNMLVTLLQENTTFRIQNTSLKTSNNEQEQKISALEGHICKAESHIDTLLCRLNNANDIIRNLQQEVKEKEMVLNQHVFDKQKVKQKYNNKIQAETNKMNRECKAKLHEQHERLRNEMKGKNQQLKLVKQILESGDDLNTILTSPKESAANLPDDYKTDVVIKDQIEGLPTVLHPVPTKISTPDTIPATSIASTKQAYHVQLNKQVRIPVVNPRYRRACSAERWIDHRPNRVVPVGTILQPLIHNKQSVTRLTCAKDITNRASRYCLVAQEQDTDGELETKLYKADILPTCSGGAQVVFNDIEQLKQLSPTIRRKRSGYSRKENTNQILSRDLNNASNSNLDPLCNTQDTEVNSKRQRV